MKISFHGAAQTVTGSKHIIHLDNGKQILLDCGLFQGRGKENEALNTHFGFHPKDIYCVFLSHAHIDHSGLLPKLVKEGFRGKIYCTPATIELAKLMLLDSAHIQQSDVVHVNKDRKKDNLPPLEPLYTLTDAMKVFEHLEPIKYDKHIKIDNNIAVLFEDAGHILGSASVHVTITENDKTTQISFSGDVGRYRDIILKSPATFPQADYIILESTYGNSLHDEYVNSDDALHKHIIETCIDKKGKLIIPAFSVGRTQEILFALNKMEIEGRLPALDYYVDSPLSIQTTEVVKKFPGLYNEHVRDLLEHDKDVFKFEGLKYITNADESIALNEVKKPMVIISASGMADAGRIKHHIAHNIDDFRNTILLVGYCEPHTLGGRLMNGDHKVRIFRHEYFVNADVKSIRSMSAHGDYDDLLQFLSCQDKEKIKKLFLVHGEPNVQIDFKKILEDNGYQNVYIPAMHESVELV